MKHRRTQQERFICDNWLFESLSRDQLSRLVVVVRVIRIIGVVFVVVTGIASGS